MIAITKKAVEFSEFDNEDSVKVIWGVCILVNLSYIFISGLNIYFQCFYFFGILFLSSVLISLYHTKNTFLRLVIGIIIPTIWFIQNVSYREMGELPFLLTTSLWITEVLLGVYVFLFSDTLAFVCEVIVALTPLNLVHNLAPNTLTIYMLFYIVHWYLKEAYFILRHKKCEEKLFSQIGVLIPLFNLPFVPMCVYYLLISSWEGYLLYSEEKNGSEDGVAKLEEVKVEPVKIVVEEEKPKEIAPPPPPPKPKMTSLPKFRPQVTQHPVTISPEPLVPKIEKKTENKNLRENLKSLYS